LYDALREQLAIFQFHIEKVDKNDKGILKYRTAINSLEVTPSESYYMHDPKKVMVYSNRVGIDMRKFIEK